MAVSCQHLHKWLDVRGKMNAKMNTRDLLDTLTGKPLRPRVGDVYRFEGEDHRVVGFVYNPYHLSSQDCLVKFEGGKPGWNEGLYKKVWWLHWAKLDTIGRGPYTIVKRGRGAYLREA